ncbi:MAG: hypothetical protein QUS13_14825 [Smithella sp.]|nr:hypothetical protein [Smithella sp.]
MSGQQAHSAKAGLNDQSQPGEFLIRKYSPAQMAAVYLFRMMLALISLPLRIGGFPLRKALYIGIGTLLYHLMRRYRRIMLTNLDIVFGNEKSPAEKKRIALGCFRHFVRVGLDFLFTDIYFPPESLVNITIENYEYFTQALEGKRGFCGVTGHLGNWELCGAILIQQGIPMSVIYKRMSSAVFDWIIGQKRIKYGFDLLQVPRQDKGIVNGKVVKKERESLRDMIEYNLLKRNRSVDFVIDQYATSGKKSVDVPFFDIPAPTHVGCIKYALEFDSPIIFAVCVYEGDVLRIIVHPPIRVERKNDEETTYIYWLTELNRKLEDLIRRYPEQWSWGHRRYYRYHYKTKKK